ncbi:MAG: hypothetical protein JO309_09435 [Pseudonocardiales bacterium]|nr:hypothetical protein [Pseudonocardiales bacterium]
MSRSRGWPHPEGATTTTREAGRIECRTARHDDGSLRFEIESWARAGDRLSHLLYNRIRLAQAGSTS